MSAIPEFAIGVPAERKGYRTSLLILGIVFLAGAGGFVYMLATAADSVPWSFLAASFIFLLGVSQFGIAFTAIMRICRAKWARPFYRVAEIATLAFLPFAFILFLIIYEYGREHLFFWLPADPDAHLSAWLDEDLFLIRNLVAQSVFYILALVYFLTGLTPDVTRDLAGTDPGLRGAFYRWLWAQKQRRNNDQLKSNMYMLAPVVLVVAVIANTFIAWDFAMMLFPHYHSTVFPMYFILGNMLAGTATIVILGAVTSRMLDLTAFFKTVQLKSMGIVITGFALFWIYMFWAQFFVTWFGNLPYETGPLWTQMFGHYGPYFWTMMTFVFALPVGSMVFAYVKRNWWSLLMVCAVIIVGVWLNRYLLVVPASIPDHAPFSSASEVLLVGGLIAGFLLAYFLLIRVFPMISAWEMRDAAGEEGPAY
jgi:molybdopterin-containing oxidoreductase family membrane subunit